ncbi:site-specific tyrosine recombinase XerD [Propionibacterium sp.]|uniref:site-specific tyrosine recombinase XerD n=1 Tax=Propionibacterium sp. TaxID=1977903 RepID=UPI00345F059F
MADGAARPPSHGNKPVSGPTAGRLGNWLEDYLDHLGVERGLSPNTVAAYRRDLTRYLRHLSSRGIDDPSRITTADVTSFEEELSRGDASHKALAPSSVGRAVVAVRMFHGFAAREGLVDHNVAAALHPPRAGKRLPKALGVDEVARLIDSIERQTPIGLRDAALFEVLYGTGARISEALSLDVDDLTRVLVDPDGPLRVVGKGNKERVVPLGSYARSAVQAWLVRGRPALAERAREFTPALFLNTRGARLSRQSAWEALRTRARQAGITADIGPHSLRHSFATHLLDGGADIRVVQELLGHASVSTTQIYTEVTAQQLREVYSSSFPRAHD